MGVISYPSESGLHPIRHLKSHRINYAVSYNKAIHSIKSFHAEMQSQASSDRSFEEDLFDAGPWLRVLTDISLTITMRKAKACKAMQAADAIKPF